MTMHMIKSDVPSHKMLPPLSSSSVVHQRHDGVPQTKLDIAVHNHKRFAHAFILNDPALMVPFLDNEIVLVVDGVRYEGLNAVLAHLVNMAMSKLSTKLHVKGKPLRTAPWQSTIIYEHGLVLKQPRLCQVIEWEQNVIVKMTHTRIFKDKNTISSTLRRRWSFPNELVKDVAKNRTRRISSISRLVRQSSQDDITISRIEVVTRLSPIRTRKGVQPYITIHSSRGHKLWMSSIEKKQTQPAWKLSDSLVVPSKDTIVISLWDYGFFHSILVANKTLTLNQLSSDNTIRLRLKPIEGVQVELCLTLQRANRFLVDPVLSQKPNYADHTTRRSTIFISLWWTVGMMAIAVLWYLFDR